MLEGADALQQGLQKVRKRCLRYGKLDSVDDGNEMRYIEGLEKGLGKVWRSCGRSGSRWAMDMRSPRSV